MENNGTNNGRMGLLKKREAEIRAQIAAEQMRVARRKAKDEAKLFTVVGRALAKFAADSPDFHLMLKQTLQIAVTDERERQFLAACGWL